MEISILSQISKRTISVDIRYALFIIDKYAGAKHLIDEMNVVYERHNEEKPADDHKQDMPEAVPSMK